MPGGVGQQRDQAEHLHEGTWPSMADDEWNRRRPSPLLVDEVDADAIHGGAEVGKRIDRPLLRPPVEAGSPILNQISHGCQVGAVFPARCGDLVRPARASQAVAQVVEHRRRDAQRVRPHLHRPLYRPHRDPGIARSSAQAREGLVDACHRPWARHVPDPETPTRQRSEDPRPLRPCAWPASGTASA